MPQDNFTPTSVPPTIPGQPVPTNNASTSSFNNIPVMSGPAVGVPASSVPQSRTDSDDSAPSISDIYTEVITRIGSSKNVLIALSANPSVDEIAAAIGLSLYLDRLGKRAASIYSGTTPNALEFLNPTKTLEPSADALQDFVIALNKDKADHLRYKLDGEYVKIYITPYRTRLSESDLEFSYGDYNVDLVISLNVTNGVDLDSALREHGRIMHDAAIINITTANPGKFGEIEWSDKSASSVSEMIATLLYNFGGEAGIEKDEATAFLTGIVAATRRFSNSKTTPRALRVASRLMESGANQIIVAKNITPDVDNELSLSVSRRRDTPSTQKPLSSSSEASKDSAIKKETDPSFLNIGHKHEMPADEPAKSQSNTPTKQSDEQTKAHPDTPSKSTNESTDSDSSTDSKQSKKPADESADSNHDAPAKQSEDSSESHSDSSAKQSEESTDHHDDATENQPDNSADHHSDAADKQDNASSSNTESSSKDGHAQSEPSGIDSAILDDLKAAEASLSEAEADVASAENQSHPSDDQSHSHEEQSGSTDGQFGPSEDQSNRAEDQSTPAEGQPTQNNQATDGITTNAPTEPVLPPPAMPGFEPAMSPSELVNSIPAPSFTPSDNPALNAASPAPTMPAPILPTPVMPFPSSTSQSADAAQGPAPTPMNIPTGSTSMQTSASSIPGQSSVDATQGELEEKPELVIKPSEGFNINSLDEEANKYGQMVQAALNSPNSPSSYVPRPSSNNVPLLLNPFQNPFQNPATVNTPIVSSAPEINGVPEMNFTPTPGAGVLPPPPTPPIDIMTGEPLTPNSPQNPSPNLPPNPMPNFTPGSMPNFTPSSMPNFTPNPALSSNPTPNFNPNPTPSFPNFSSASFGIQSSTPSQPPVSPQPSMPPQPSTPPQFPDPSAFKIPGR